LATAGGLPRKVETFSVPVTIRYFHPSGIFAGAGATYVDQQLRSSDPDSFADGSDDFVVVDALVGYRFPKRFGIASLEVNNLFNTGFHYQDDSFRNFKDEPLSPRFVPERAVVGRITINF
jgi:outer membrane receptor protein involved in Fe transport